MNTLGLRTDLMVMGDRSTVVDHGRYWSQTTMSEPDFWFGNQIIIKDHRTPRAQSEAWFKAHFPKARHCVISFDTTDLTPGMVDPAYGTEGLSTDVCDVLQRRGAPDTGNWPVKQIAGDTDWQPMQKLSLAIATEDGFDPASHAGFLTRRFATYRHRIVQGAGVWLTVWDGIGLAGQLGIFTGNGMARFQSVETRADARGQGIASTLLAAGCRFATAQAADVPITIVTEQDSAAARLYRKAGFALVETCLAASRPGYKTALAPSG